jgi:hypothetical protein
VDRRLFRQHLRPSNEILVLYLCLTVFKVRPFVTDTDN